MSDKHWMDIAYDDYKREEDQRLNGHFPWTFVQRVAFSRWRRAVLHMSVTMDRVTKYLPTRRLRMVWRHWCERMNDALYPDDCLVAFAAAP
jgi:hypothetical protein